MSDKISLIATDTVGFTAVRSIMQGKITMNHLVSDISGIGAYHVLVKPFIDSKLKSKLDLSDPTIHTVLNMAIDIGGLSFAIWALRQILGSYGNGDKIVGTPASFTTIMRDMVVVKLGSEVLFWLMDELKK